MTPHPKTDDFNIEEVLREIFVNFCFDGFRCQRLMTSSKAIIKRKNKQHFPRKKIEVTVEARMFKSLECTLHCIDNGKILVIPKTEKASKLKISLD